MPVFITYASYSQSGVKGLMASPSDRGAAISAMVEKAGGEMLAMYMTTGEHDVVLVTRFDDADSAVALAMVAAASGSVSKMTTERAWPTADFVAVAKKAKDMASLYAPPGA